MISNLAALTVVTRALFAQAAQQHGSRLGHLLDLQRQCCNVLAVQQGIPMAALTSAIADLDRAAQTAAYLESLPDMGAA